MNHPTLAAGDPVGGDAAQHAARTELRRAVYRQAGPDPLTRLVRWLRDRLEDLLRQGSPGSHAFLLLLVVLAAVGIVFAVRAGAPRRTAGRGTGAAEIDPLAPVAARDHRRIAARLTAEGRHAEALREWLRAAVATIEERGALPPQPGRTGAATARAAGPLLPAAATDLDVATAAFDQVWFGGRAARAEDVVRARAAADAVVGARLAVRT